MRVLEGGNEPAVLHVHVNDKKHNYFLGMSLIDCGPAAKRNSPMFIFYFCLVVEGKSFLLWLLGVN